MGGIEFWWIAQKQKAFYVHICIASSQSLYSALVYVGAHLFAHMLIIMESMNILNPPPTSAVATALLTNTHNTCTQTDKQVDRRIDTMEKGMVHERLVHAYIILSKLRNWNHKPDVKWDIYRIPHRRCTLLSQANAILCFLHYYFRFSLRWVLISFSIRLEITISKFFQNFISIFCHNEII